MIGSNRIDYAREMPVLPSTSLAAEGLAVELAIDTTTGTEAVVPSTGSGTAIFAGVAFSQTIAPGVVPRIESLRVPGSAAYSVKLAKTPMTGTLLVKANGTVLTVVSVAPASGEVQYIPLTNTLLFHSTAANATVYAAYKVALTVIESSQLYGDQPITNRTASELLNSTQVIKQGTIETDQYDTTSDWTGATAATPIFAGANGQFTLASGNTPTGARLVKAPSESNAFLGLSINVA